jgi:DNA polymerase-3 subunit epsilon
VTRRVAIFDTETSGVDPESDRIVSAFFGILSEDGNLEEAHDYLIAPDGWEIPQGAIDVHGITNEYARENGDDEYKVLRKIYVDIVTRCVDERIPLCGHNLVYDLTIFDRCIQRFEPGTNGASVQEILDQGLIVLDSLVIDKRVDRYRKGKRTLITAAEVYGVELSEEEAHGARADAIASGRIIQYFFRHMPEEIPGPKRAMALQKAWKAEQAASLQEYFRTQAPEPNPAAYVDPNWPLIPRPTEEGEFE